MKTIDKLNLLVGKEYNEDTFHCWNLVEAVLPVPKLKDVHVASANDDVDKYLHLFTELKEPVDFCIVLLGKSHVGIYYQGGIYHADKPMVRYEKMRAMKLKYKGFKWYL